MPRTPRPPLPPPTTLPERTATAERWAMHGGDSAVATLLIPAHATRERRFEVACAMTVKLAHDAAEAWHEMAVTANGALLWRRRVATHNAGSFDGLDYRFARSVSLGEALRITLTVQLRGGQRRSVDIEAEEL